MGMRYRVNKLAGVAHELTVCLECAETAKTPRMGVRICCARPRVAQDVAKAVRARADGCKVRERSYDVPRNH